MSLTVRNIDKHGEKLRSFTIVSNGREFTITADEFERVARWYAKENGEIEEAPLAVGMKPAPAEWDALRAQPTRIYTIKGKGGHSEVPDEVARAYYKAALAVMRKYGGAPLPPQADVCKELGIERPRGETMKLLFDKLYHLGYIDRLSTAKGGTSQWAWLGIPLHHISPPTKPPFRKPH